MIEKDGKIYLTIAEFAKSAGISKQAVYYQLDSRLESYLIQVENKRMIEKSALERFYSSQLEQLDSSQNSSFSQVDSSQNQDKTPAEKIDLTKEMFDFLKQEIENRDKQIEKLQDNVIDLTKQITNLSNQISEIAQKTVYVTAADKTAQIIDKQEKRDNIVNTAAAESQNTEKKKKWFQFWK